MASPKEPPGPSSAATRHWAFAAPRRHPLLAVKDPAWPRRRIDHFILRRLEDAGLCPSPPADQRTMIRRLSFDLTGLPPTPEAVERFVADPSPRAYEDLVEELLASPAYGERWTRRWLDVARYAEDQAHIVGNNKSLFYPNAYLYRDWVIDAFNRDLPYDEFVRLQLADDMLHPKDTSERAALGFIGLGPKYYNRNNPVVMADEWEDRVDTVTRGFLGLTVACARCHDHKYDPITTQDYYALAGVFASTEMYNWPSAPDATMHIVREGKPRDLNVFIRGDVTKKGPVVKRRFLRILCREETAPFQHGSGRAELADAIVDPDNPLTARVIVNRVWAAYFGRGLVGTLSNFGVLGERPSHPELLDDLAVRFIASGWSLKWLHRELALSATYRQRSAESQAESPALSPAQPRTAGVTVDPGNRLLWRMPRRRRGVEEWRDAILAASGQLDLAIGGPSVNVADAAARRRTVYGRVSRFQLNPMLALFDFPDPNVHAARRSQTTTPLQKLFVLNSPFMIAQARALAGRIGQLAPARSDSGPPTPSVDSVDSVNSVNSLESSIRRAYGFLYARSPSGEEMRVAREFLASATGAQRDAFWEQYAQALLATNEMLFID